VVAARAPRMSERAEYGYAERLPCGHRGAANCIKTRPSGKVGLKHESTHATATPPRWTVGDDPLRAGQQRSNDPIVRHLYRLRLTGSGCRRRWPAASRSVEDVGRRHDRFRETSAILGGGSGSCSAAMTSDGVVVNRRGQGLVPRLATPRFAWWS
jgi:hypothetical protein